MMRQPMENPEPSPGDLRVAVIAADPLARAGLASLLAEEPDVQLVASLDLTTDPEALLAQAPEVLLIDLGWEVEGEQELLEVWLELELTAVLLVPGDRSSAPLWGLGAAGLLRRSGSRAQLVSALRAVAAGLRVHDAGFAAPRPDPRPDSVPSEPLTPRELEVLQHLAEGSSNRAIAQALAISEHTVKFHVTAILAKLGAESRTEAAIIAARAGLILL
jgi:DNA-binding NarL/FixJ family response regulator